MLKSNFLLELAVNKGALAVTVAIDGSVTAGVVVAKAVSRPRSHRLCLLAIGTTVSDFPSPVTSCISDAPIVGIVECVGVVGTGNISGELESDKTLFDMLPNKESLNRVLPLDVMATEVVPNTLPLAAPTDELESAVVSFTTSGGWTVKFAVFTST